MTTLKPGVGQNDVCDSARPGADGIGPYRTLRGGAVGYEQSWEPEGVVIRFFGQVSYQDLMNSGLEMYGDYRFNGLRYVIYDYLDTEKLVVEDVDIPYLFAVDRSAYLRNSHLLRAVVATSRPVIDLVHRFATASLKAYPPEIFATMADARSWIGLAPHR